MFLVMIYYHDPFVYKVFTIKETCFMFVFVLVPETVMLFKSGAFRIQYDVLTLGGSAFIACILFEMLWKGSFAHIIKIK